MTNDHKIEFDIVFFEWDKSNSFAVNLLVVTLQIGVKYLIVGLRCHAYAFAQNQQYFNIFCVWNITAQTDSVYLLGIIWRITAANLNGRIRIKFCRNVGLSQILCIKMLAPSAKWALNGGEKSGSFCNEYNEFAFLCNGTDQHEIWGGGNVNRCAVLNLNRRILKIYP